MNALGRGIGVHIFGMALHQQRQIHAQRAFLGNGDAHCAPIILVPLTRKPLRTVDSNSHTKAPFSPGLAMLSAIFSIGVICPVISAGPAASACSTAVMPVAVMVALP